jgi:TatD DNase family protein
VIDTHAHLDALQEPAAEVLARARDAGVTRVVAVGSGLPSCQATLAIAAREQGVHAALGLHPHQAGEVSDNEVAELRELLSDPRAVAVGETGLDYYRDYAPRDRQLQLFRMQADLAVELGKALVVHSRAADEDTAAVLAQLPADHPVVLHCFSSVGLVGPALERGYFVSFAGNVTYPKAAELRAAAARIPAERLLAETDSPFLAPQPVRGRSNEPAHVVHTLAVLADARGEEPDGLERTIDANADAAFRL